MPILRRIISLILLIVVFFMAPAIFAADKAALAGTADSEIAVKAADLSSFTIETEAEATVLYEEMSLSELGLSKTAFDYAYKGFKALLNKGVVSKESILSVVDFSQSSNNKRLYIIDVENKDIIKNTYVAHGKNSGNEFANNFSNKLSSLKSSLGFYVTKGTYYGEHGLSLKIEGMEKGINDNAERRAVVVHGADYLGDNYLNRKDVSGRSWGCPAVPSNESQEIINTIKDGSVMFIYHPSTQYLKRSRIING